MFRVDIYNQTPRIADNLCVLLFMHWYQVIRKFMFLSVYEYNQTDNDPAYNHSRLFPFQPVVTIRPSPAELVVMFGENWRGVPMIEAKQEPVRLIPTYVLAMSHHSSLFGEFYKTNFLSILNLVIRIFLFVMTHIQM